MPCFCSAAPSLFPPSNSSPLPTPPQTPVEPKASHSFDLNAIDKTADPCADFYQYACGNWLKTNPIPSDQSRWGRFNELRRAQSTTSSMSILEKAAEPTPRRDASASDRRLLRRLHGYEGHAEKKGDQPRSRRIFARIDALKDKNDSSPAGRAAFTSKASPTRVFQLRLGQDYKDATKLIAAVRSGRARPARPRLLLQERRQVSRLRQQVRRHVAQVFELAGDDPETRPPTRPPPSCDFETALAKGSLDRVDAAATPRTSTTS